jgi:L-lactate dehydrogenase (cytochrome)
MIATSTRDFRDAARRRLPRFLFDYIDGAGDETTLRRNLGDLSGLAVRQRVLKDVSGVDLTTSLFGRQLATPIVLGPVGLSGLYARRGEAQAARVAAERGLPFCLSTVSIRDRTEPR